MPVRKKRSKEQEPAKMKRNPVKIVTRDLTDIHPYKDNPRDNESAVESVMKSISSFGFLVPIVVDGAGVIVAGHTRYEAATRLGLTDAPCIIAGHLTEEQIKAFRLIDNKVSELARWDTDLLAGELAALEGSGINFTEFGWDQDEIDCLTEIVTDDCLSVGSAAGDDSSEGSRPEQRAPNRTRMVIGEFTLFIPQDVYRRWSSEIRASYDYVESDIEAALKDRLGITPYENA